MLKSYLYTILFFITLLSGIAQRTNTRIGATKKHVKSSIIEIPIGNPAASISPSAYIKCWPNSSFTFSNTSTNCLPNGNFFQRMEKWNLGNYWGLGKDSIIEWRATQNQSSITISYPNVGTYSVQLQDSSLCGIDTAYLSITVANIPIANLTAPVGPNCQGTPITFTNTSSTGYLYKWNFGAGGGFVAKPYGNQSFIYNSPGTSTISLIALVGGGGAMCTDTEKVVITILPRPTAHFSISINKGCDSIIGVNFQDLSLNAVDWNWNFDNSSTHSGLLPPAQNYYHPGIFSPTLTVTSSNSCTHSFELPITVYQKPKAFFLTQNGCVDSPTPFTDNSTHASNDAIIAWKWNFNTAISTFTSNIQNPSPIYTLQNTYSVQLIVQTANCSDTIYQNVTIKNKPTINFTAIPSNGCQSFSVNFSNFSVNSNSYAWNFGNGNSSSDQNPTENFVNNTALDKTYSVSLTATNSDGCSSKSYSTITVFAKPISTFSLNTNIGCSPFKAYFTNFSSGANQYMWNFGDTSPSSTSSLSIVSHTYQTNSIVSQTFSIGLIAISSNNCRDSSYSYLTIHPKPNFDYSLSLNKGCSPFGVKFPLISNSSTYLWNFGDNSSPDSSQEPFHSFLNKTNTDISYNVELIASNQFGCKDTVYKTITVYKNPIAQCIITPSVGCPPLNVACNNTSISAQNYEWKFGDGETSTAMNTSHSYTNASHFTEKTYSCTLIVKSNEGCKDSITNPIITFFKPKANFTVDTPACSSKPLIFTNTSIGGSYFNWNLGTTSSTLTSITHTFYNSTNSSINQTIELITKSIDNCSDMISIPLTIYPKPHFSILSDTEKGCTPLSVNLSSSNGIKTYYWNFGDGNTSSSSSVNHKFYNYGSSSVSYSVSLIGSDKHGCSDTTFKTITVFDKPIALFETNTTLVTALSSTLECINKSTGANEYEWSFGDNSHSFDTNPNHVYQSEGEFRIFLIATNTHGCKDTFQLSSNIISELKPSIEVPNAFTPNTISGNGGYFNPNDLNNDIFYPVLKGIKDYELTIYSRWGELLFISNNPLIGWDGYFKEKLCTQDVYIWKIVATDNKGEKIIKTGDVTLLK